MWFQVAGGVLLFLLITQVLLVLYGSGRRYALEQHILQQRLTLLKQRSEFALAATIAEKQRAELSWNGLRKFVVQRIEQESEEVKSFYLAPHDAKELQPFLPGQYLTLQARLPNSPKPLVRCYSLSSAPSEVEYYRITIKRKKAIDEAPEGKVSNLFHADVRAGDTLDCKAPSGHFFYALNNPKPAILIAGGIGLTPVFSIFSALAQMTSPPECWLFYGVSSPQEALMLESLREISQQHEQLHLRICFSKSMDGLMPGVENIKGRVSVALMKDMLPSNNYQFFVCAPSRMMEQMIADLIDWQVPQDDIHLEAFGAATVKSSSSAARIVGKKGSSPCSVTFKRSRKQVLWTPEDGTILDLAEANGVVIDTGCRAGNCGSCFTAIQSGEVDYLVPPGAEHEESVCLPCVCTPGSDLVVDA